MPTATKRQRGRQSRQQVKRERLIRRWKWLAVGAGLLVALGVAVILARPGDPVTQAAADLRVGEAHTFFSPT